MCRVEEYRYPKGFLNIIKKVLRKCKPLQVLPVKEQKPKGAGMGSSSCRKNKLKSSIIFAAALLQTARYLSPTMVFANRPNNP